MASSPAKTITETDLYQPIHDYLAAQGYTVRSEVRNCDVTATRGDELIIVELKRNFGVSVLMQATERQRITNAVYVGLPRPRGGTGTPQWKGVRRLLRRLELGLILVSLDTKRPKVEVAFHPLPYDRKKIRRARTAVIREINGRSADFNQGGSTRRKIATAYRESAIHIACCLERFGPMSPKQLRALGTGERTQSILASNFYGWFERIHRGVYALKPQGSRELNDWPRAVEHYRQLIDQHGPTQPEQERQ